VRYSTLVGLVADRFRWWANPPLVARPTPALTGWTLDEWLRQAGIRTPAPDERFRTLFPGPVALHGNSAEQLAGDALRQLTLEDEVEPMPGQRGVWRARPKDRSSA
jgi:hypothetical protein